MQYGIDFSEPLVSIKAVALYKEAKRFTVTYKVSGAPPAPSRRLAGLDALSPADQSPILSRGAVPHIIPHSRGGPDVDS